MIVKFFTEKRANNSPRKMMNYLLRTDEKASDKIRLLKGDPSLSRVIAESLDFSKNYTAGCLSFMEENLDEKQKEYIMEEFEKMAFAGMQKEQYNITWIEHRDKGRLELNFFSPEVDLASGKRFQMYYHKRDITLFNSFRDKINFEFGLANPLNADRRQRSITPKGQSKEVNDIRKVCEGLTFKWYNEGEVSNRTELIEKLCNELDCIPAKDKKGNNRVGKDSITLIFGKDKPKKIRLKGGYYEEVADFSKDYKDIAHIYYNDDDEYERFPEEPALSSPKSNFYLKQALKTLNDETIKRAERHQKRYALTEATEERILYEQYEQRLNAKESHTSNRERERTPTPFANFQTPPSKNRRAIDSRNRAIADTNHTIAKRKRKSDKKQRELDERIEQITQQRASVTELHRQTTEKTLDLERDGKEFESGIQSEIRAVQEQSWDIQSALSNAGARLANARIQIEQLEVEQGQKTTADIKPAPKPPSPSYNSSPSFGR